MSGLPKRPFGKTGVELSVLGFGGIVVKDVEQDHADRVVAEAVERGVNYFDVAPFYGNAQDHLGPALEPFRKDVFLACKSGERDYEGAKKDFERSLELLRTDYFDLYQLHGLADMEATDASFADGGAMELFVEARDAGKIRFLGFSVHSAEAALAAMARFDFDSVLFPLNFAEYFRGDLGRIILRAAEENGLARLALKAMACQKWPENHPQRDTYKKCWYEPLIDERLAKMALRFTLSQSVTAAVSPGEEALFRVALDAVEDLSPITDDEEEELRKLADELNPIFVD